MKKLSKFLFILFVSFCLSSSLNSRIFTEKTNIYEGLYNLADYNELYGVESSNTPQIQYNPTTQNETVNLKYLAVFIEFSDSEKRVTNHLDDPQSVANAEMMLNSDELFEMNGPTGTIKVPSFKKYYETQSYGKFSITTEIFPKVNGEVVSYKDIHPENYYKPYSSSNPDGYKDKAESMNRETALIDRAIEAISKSIEDSGIEEHEIDTGSDGIVDAISFFIEGREPLSAGIGWGDLLWSHKLDNYGLTSTILGKQVISYNLLYTYDYTDIAGLFSLNRGTYGTIMHEFGHTLGLTDLYRFDQSSSKPVGFYDIMGNSSGSNPQNLLSYFTSEYSSTLAWHNPLKTIDKTTQNVTIYKPKFIDDDETRSIKIQTDKNSKEYFIVEYFAKQDTYNTYTADSDGLIVYRVNDNNKYMGNKEGGDHGELDHIFVYRPEEPNLGAGLGKLTEATLNMTRPRLGKSLKDSPIDFDNEAIYYANGSNSGLIIEVVSETPDSITIDITLPALEGSGTKNDPYLIRSVSDFLYFTQNDSKGKHFKLMNDLDFQDVTSYPSIEFMGNLDGSGHSLKNIKSSTGVFNNLGTYGTPTRIENLVVENIEVSSTTGSYLGGFASITSDVTIENVRLLSGFVNNVASVMGNPLDSTGGFVGNASSSTVIKDSSSSLTVSAPNNVGGFIGLNMNAYIVNSFFDGTVKGSTNVGGFIGLQCIMDSTYKVPVNVLYNKKTSSLKAVGGYGALHNLNALKEDELSKGITSVAILDKLTILKNEVVEIAPSFDMDKKMNYTIWPENQNILEYKTGMLKGLSAGQSILHTSITVGSGQMRLRTSVLVRDESVKITEEEVLKYFGLTKKESYLVGFAFKDLVSDVKNHLSSFSGVTLKEFKNSNGQSISSGFITTGMTCTLLIENEEYKYTIVLKGDVDGDGEIFATDYVKIKNHIMGRSALTGAYLMAADIDNDQNIYATDYVKIKNYIMGRGNIPQNW